MNKDIQFCIITQTKPMARMTTTQCDDTRITKTTKPSTTNSKGADTPEKDLQRN